MGFRARIAKSDADLRAVQALRYEVFAGELGADGGSVDHAARLERDRFDPDAIHVMLEHDAAPGRCIGTTRIRREAFYTAGEFDLAPLERSGRPLVEIGRACLARDWRGAALGQLWAAVAAELSGEPDALAFGVASFPGTDLARLSMPLSWLEAHHAAPLEIAPISLAPAPFERIAPADLDRRAALAGMPALLRAYLRLGAQIGQGAFVDHGFNCVDVCVLVETARLAQRPRVGGRA